MNRVAWEDLDRGNGSIGEVGFITIGQTRIKIASISWSVTRNDSKPWVLRTEIPGWKNARHHETPDDAKASVERVLTTFTTALRPDPPDKTEVRLAAENAHESGYPNNEFSAFLHGFQCAVNWLSRGRG